jgi:hypothetical protein
MVGITFEERDPERVKETVLFGFSFGRLLGMKPILRIHQ